MLLKPSKNVFFKTSCKTRENGGKIIQIGLGNSENDSDFVDQNDTKIERSRCYWNPQKNIFQNFMKNAGKWW